MKLHLGCGTIYLKGYVNVDAAPEFMAEDAPDLVEENSTTMDNYYKDDFCKNSGLTVADSMAVLPTLPFDDESAEEAVMIHVLEHFPKYEAKKVLNEIWRVLIPGGKFIVGVPDIMGTAKQLLAAKTDEEQDWCIRLIEGTQKNKWSHHYCSYSDRTLKNFLSEHGFGDFEDLPNINFYPALHVKATKVAK